MDNIYKKFFKRLGGLPSFRKRIKYKSFTLKGSAGYKISRIMLFLLIAMSVNLAKIK